MITASNITDEQIREARRDVETDLAILDAALKITTGKYARQIREAAAEIVNARAAAQPAPAFADEEIAEQIAVWLDAKAKYYEHNRNIGPYSAELAAAIRRGDHKRAAAPASQPIAPGDRGAMRQLGTNSMHMLSVGEQALIVDALAYITTPGAEELRNLLLGPVVLHIEHNGRCTCGDAAKEPR